MGPAIVDHTHTPGGPELDKVLTNSNVGGRVLLILAPQTPVVTRARVESSITPHDHGSLTARMREREMIIVDTTHAPFPDFHPAVSTLKVRLRQLSPIAVMWGLDIASGLIGATLLKAAW